MDIKKIINTLHPLERSVLPFLKTYASLDEIIRATVLKEVEVTRALQWLQNKKIIEVEDEVEEKVDLDINGKKYIKEGLPERKLLNLLKEKALTIPQVISQSDLTKDELNICIGILKKKAAIFITKEKELVIKLTDQGKKLLNKEMLEEKFLKLEFPIPVKDLKDEGKFTYDTLKKRKKIVKTILIKTKKVKLTDLGNNILDYDIQMGNIIDKVTIDIIKKGIWKNKEFRRYDVAINVPKIHPGKRHFVNQAIEYVKRVWMDLGFKEMTGSLVQTSFWNFDALFTAQDHPVRDMQDTFFVKNPMYGKLPDKVLVERVKKTHQNGWNTGSKGWGYEWSMNEARKNVLRTHTTCLSARTIAKLTKKDLPAKFFSIGRCFRNETVDWSHLFELIQVEGIVIDPDANFRHLIGYLKEFFRKMGFEKVRVRPGYFPYTEPSAEVDVFHPLKKKWIELGGSGIFRPEMVKPLFGEEIPVLAWGLGLERSILDYYEIKDIRDIYSNDLRQLKEIKLWLE